MELRHESESEAPARTTAQGDSTARLARLAPGALAAFAEPTVVIAELQGGALAIALYDQDAGVGGVHHFVTTDAPRACEIACERLLARVLALGGRTLEMRARLFGAVGPSAASVETAKRSLDDYGIPVASVDAAARPGRRVFFEIPNGKARVLALEAEKRGPWNI